ncbi:hypothetical protein [Citricoccus muralis]|uniref:hypothetical protein n=1 Tax=Citricoccus muralis TaxID=169134 RepID=UPI0011C03B8B|nr:hypothetical protein [Citricoccus muralis]
MGSTGSTILQQFGPMIAATIALIGAMIALWVNGRREEQRNRTAREDDFRREQRQAFADVLTTAHTYRREAELLGTMDSWLHSDHPSTTAMKDRVDQASGELLNKLTVARLIVHGPTLQGALDDAFIAFQNTRGSIQPIVDAYSSGRSEDMTGAIAALDVAWPPFSKAMAVLQSVALSELRPTIAPTERRL